jgi:hypothetical protein
MGKHLQKTFSMEKLVSHMRNIYLRADVLINLCYAIEIFRGIKLNSYYLIKLIFILSIVFQSCKFNHNPVENNFESGNLTLKQKMIGGWKSGSYVIYFKEDGTYIDSSGINPFPLEPGYDTSNICSESTKDGLHPIRVTEGLYLIEDSILKRQPTDYMLDCNPLNAPACYVYHDKLIDIIDDTLKLTTYRVWYGCDSLNNDIWGNWISNYWVWAYHADLPLGGSPQLVTDSITFIEDSTVYHLINVGLPFPDILYRVPFTYDPPTLYVISSYEFYTVSIKENEMHWFQKNRTLNYLRIK